MAVAALALLGAASWGTGDFLGGLASRRIHVLTVLVLSQAIGLCGAVLWLLASGDGVPGVGDLLPAAGAGACGAIGLAALYRGMAVGAMGIVAPISAASPIVPLAVDLGRGVSPSAAQWAGIVAVLGGIVLLAREPGTGRRTPLAAGVALALVAALAFGLFIVGLDAAADGSVPWTIVTARGTSTALALVLALATSVSIRPPARLVPDDRRGRRLRHDGQRPRRLRDHEGIGRHRRSPERSLPRRHDRPRAGRARRAARPAAPARRRARPRRRRRRRRRIAHLRVAVRPLPARVLGCGPSTGAERRRCFKGRRR